MHHLMLPLASQAGKEWGDVTQSLAFHVVRKFLLRSARASFPHCPHGKYGLCSNTVALIASGCGLYQAGHRRGPRQVLAAAVHGGAAGAARPPTRAANIDWHDDWWP